MTATTLVFVGCLNQAVPHFAAANGKGISVFAFDETTGKLSWLADTVDTPNPTYLAVLPEPGMLYATSEVFGWREGLISAYRIDKASGSLTLVGARQTTRGSLTAHCNTDHQGTCVFVANYSHETPGEVPGRHVASFSIMADGSLTPAISEFSHHDAGPRADRQAVPHAHCVVPGPDNRFVVVPDLGGDQLITYELDATSGRLAQTDIAPLRMAPGSGPRHLVFHPDGAIAYVINELSNTLCRLAYESETGTLQLLQSVDGLPPDAAPSFAADLCVSANGRFLYATYRGDNSVLTYALDEKDGTILTGVRQDSGGKTPRSFTLSPSGKFMLVSNQDSDVLVSLRLDPDSGKPLEQVDAVSIGTPMCVKAARFA
ncbi:lactonase family protein [Caballeronia sp. SEWSISQ10-4 2]|uniref:lactonase family protein n=1 Tax=Caballeronia sp. SEWSISQ10-4 2 TaxID=2937438 RepID=UPI0026516927|nr:lactonase family protein [Caballeronia sp. SEWSISQ10-4 2]MDN7182984.1 lactonase family protein [Caballeronia sp. SEWSISQ10-4 2]